MKTKLIVALLLLGSTGAIALSLRRNSEPPPPPESNAIHFQPRKKIELSGFAYVTGSVARQQSSGQDQSAWEKAGEKAVAQGGHGMDVDGRLRAICACNYDGETRKALDLLEKLRTDVQANEALAKEWLYTVIYAQGVTSMRLGENDNCIACRGESSCILPIAPAAVHTNPAGSRAAIEHYTEYLDKFPNDLEIRWLLNLAHMTLGEHPDKVDQRYLMTIERFVNSEFDIGRFRDVAHVVGIDRLNQAGGAILEDFDNDGLLDIVFTSQDPTVPMVFYHNKGDGTFEDRTAAAGLSNQTGGLNCVQVDYNNDGFMDVYVPRGAWLTTPMRPSLLRNNGDGTFTDVTEAAGLADSVNSNSACWADYDNDGFLDLFVCCEQQPNRLYHNKGDGTFEEVSNKVGLFTSAPMCKGATWIDYDNDGYPDLFINYLFGEAQLFHNRRDGTFTRVSLINGPVAGFSCWAFDFDNDGWIDIFAACRDQSLEDVVLGLLGKPHKRESNRLYRNMQGHGFKDVTKQAGLDMVFASMGSNFADFDNDGYLDFYLGTGDPDLSMLVPNRMFKNVGGKRFAEITGSAHTGHLQKGHGVALGDWDRNGTVDIVIQMGGNVNGDKYHNILFQNPGQGNNWLTVKLVGKKTNHAAIGARIKAVMSGDQPLTVHRHVSSGSSFGANPLQQHLGMGKSDRVAELEIYWPTSGAKQVFRDIPANHAIEITEFAETYKTLNWSPIRLPE